MRDIARIPEFSLPENFSERESRNKGIRKLTGMETLDYGSEIANQSGLLVCQAILFILTLTFGSESRITSHMFLLLMSPQILVVTSVIFEIEIHLVLELWIRFGNDRRDL